MVHINHEVSFVVVFGLDRHKSFNQRSAQAVLGLHFDVQCNQVQHSGACANMRDSESGQAAYRESRVDGFKIKITD